MLVDLERSLELSRRTGVLPRDEARPAVTLVSRRGRHMRRPSRRLARNGLSSRAVRRLWVDRMLVKRRVSVKLSNLESFRLLDNACRLQPR